MEPNWHVWNEVHNPSDRCGGDVDGFFFMHDWHAQINSFVFFLFFQAGLHLHCIILVPGSFISIYCSIIWTLLCTTKMNDRAKQPCVFMWHISRLLPKYPSVCKDCSRVDVFQSSLAQSQTTTWIQTIWNQTIYHNTTETVKRGRKKQD